MAGLLTGCGERIHVRGFEEYVYRFEDEARQRGVFNIIPANLTIYFDENMKDYVEADCNTEGDYPMIRVHGSKWVQKPDLIKEVILFHELGHCLLHRGHVFSPANSSIMYPYVLPLDTYEAHRSYFLDELFLNR